MQAAAAAERERVERELRRLNEREDRVARELDTIRAARSALEGEVVLLQRLSRDPAEGGFSAANGEQRRLRVVSDALPAVEDGGEVVLRGAQIRETAVRLLASTGQADRALHYRTWFELLRQEGLLPAGKDPLATFLTQIGRSPVVQRSTAPGVYSLDLDFPERARIRLAQLQAGLREADEVPVGASVDEIAQLRDSRAKLKAEVASAEQVLTEALRSLGG
jgi:hypothetical protein